MSFPQPAGLLESVDGKPLPQTQDTLANAMLNAQGRNGSTLTMHGRIWQVGSGATTTSIPILDSNGLPVLLSSSMQAQYTNAKFEIIQAGTVELAVVTAVGASGTLTLDSSLSSAPSAGTWFLLTPTQQTSLAGSNMTLSDGQTSYAPGMEYNGSTYDRKRNNIQGILLASGARTATTPSPTITNYNARGVNIYLYCSVASGTGGLTMTLYGADILSSHFYKIASNTTPITAPGEYAISICPGATGNSGTTNSIVASASFPVPRQWYVNVSVGDGTSYTYSLGYDLIN